MTRWLVLAAALGACSFEHGSVGAGAGDGGAAGEGGARGSDGGQTIHDARYIDAARDAFQAQDGSGSGPACPATYALHDSARPNSYYRSVTASTTWQAAETDCENDATAGELPGHLIVLDNSSELDWAFTQNNSQQWVGEQDINTEGTFLAVTDQATFYLVATGNSTPKDCAILGNFSSVNTTQIVMCSDSHPYLCECDGSAAVSANF